MRNKIRKYRKYTPCKKSSPLRNWLNRNKISVTFLAELLRIDRSYIHKWTRGIEIPSAAIMRRLVELSMGHVENIKDLVDEEERKGDGEEEHIEGK